MSVDLIARDVFDTLKLDGAQARDAPVDIRDAREHGQDVVVLAVAVHKPACDDAPDCGPVCGVGGDWAPEEVYVVNDPESLGRREGGEVLEGFEYDEGPERVPNESDGSTAKDPLGKECTKYFASLHSEGLSIHPRIIWFRHSESLRSSL